LSLQANLAAVLRVPRTIWLAHVSSALLLGVVALLVSELEPDLPLLLPVALVAAISIAMFVGVVAVERLYVATPPASDGEALAGQRTRFFVQLAIGQLPLLLGFVLAFTLGPPWIGLVGALGTLACALRSRPSYEQFARLDRGWQAQGHDVSILRLLREP
jgi:hypothetical protein